MRLLQLPDLKYFYGVMPTVGNLPDDCWLEKQSLLMPFLCSPQVFLHGGQRPQRNNAFPSPLILIPPLSSSSPFLYSCTALPKGGKPASSFASPPAPHPPTCDQSPRPYKCSFQIAPRCFCFPIDHSNTPDPQGLTSHHQQPTPLL